MNTKPAPEIVKVPQNADEVVCDGGNGAMGHPQVYYTFHKQDQVSCGYCGRIFTKK